MIFFLRRTKAPMFWISLNDFENGRTRCSVSSFFYMLNTVKHEIVSMANWTKQKKNNKKSNKNQMEWKMFSNEIESKCPFDSWTLNTSSYTLYIKRKWLNTGIAYWQNPNRVRCLYSTFECILILTHSAVTERNESYDSCICGLLFWFDICLCAQCENRNVMVNFIWMKDIQRLNENYRQEKKRGISFFWPNLVYFLEQKLYYFPFWLKIFFWIF